MFEYHCMCFYAKIKVKKKLRSNMKSYKLISIFIENTRVHFKTENG